MGWPMGNSTFDVKRQKGWQMGNSPCDVKKANRKVNGKFPM